MARPLRVSRPSNHLLTMLSPSDYALLQPHLEPIVLNLRLRLELPNKPIEHVVFPEDGIVSVVALTPKREEIEAGIIGREGMTGVSIIMGNDRWPFSTYVQMRGAGQRMPAGAFRDALRKSPSLQRIALNYAQAFNTQTMHTGLANGRAKLEERLARWILMAHDRIGKDDLPFTHEFLALMLGVRRAGVTVALNLLEKKALIGTKRGFVTLLDRAGVEKTAKGFYGVPEAEYARLIDWHPDV